MPLKVTDVAPVKLAPLIVTLAPIAALGGVKLVIRGATVKLAALVAVPPGAITVIGPLVALPGTVRRDLRARIDRERGCGAVELDRGRAGEVRAGDHDVTPTAPLLGENPPMVGAKFTVKLVVLVPVPADIVTPMRPVVAPTGTLAVIRTAELTAKVADAPLNVTDDAPVKFAPLMMTLAPTPPFDGVKLVMRGRHDEARRAGSGAAGRRGDADRSCRGIRRDGGRDLRRRVDVEGGRDAVESHRRHAGEIRARDRDARADGTARGRESGDARRHGEAAPRSSPFLR